jgi:hypothetical protein
MIQQPMCTKIRSSKAHSVAFFCHKDWQRCATSIISFSIMARLANLSDSQVESFFAYDQKGIPNWYKYYLIDWQDYNPMAEALKKKFHL